MSDICPNTKKIVGVPQPHKRGEGTENCNLCVAHLRRMERKQAAQ